MVFLDFGGRHRGGATNKPPELYTSVMLRRRQLEMHHGGVAPIVWGRRSLYSGLSLRIVWSTAAHG